MICPCSIIILTLLTQSTFRPIFGILQYFVFTSLKVAHSMVSVVLLLEFQTFFLILLLITENFI